MNMMLSVVYKAVLENDVQLIKEALNKHNLLLKDLTDKTHNERLVFLAVEQNSQDVVIFLVENGANVNGSTSVDMSPIILAIRQGNVKMTELLIDLGANIATGKLSKNVVRPLHFAVSSLNLDIVLLLVNKGANVHAQDVFNNETALHLVCNYNYVYSSDEDKRQKMQIQVKIAKALLENGACTDAKNIDGLTPLDCALNMFRPEICKLLLLEGAPVKNTRTDGTYYEYLEFPGIFTCPQLTRLCLERGCDFSRRLGKHGSLTVTPYHNALQYTTPEIVKIFLEFGCPFDLPGLVFNDGSINYEINSRVLSVQKEFIEGINNNSLQSVKAAIVNGAEPRGCSMNVPSTLHRVAVKDNPKLAELLILNGVPVNSVNKKGKTPLFLAVKKKNVEVFKILLKFGACINFGHSNKNNSKVVVESCDEIKVLFKTIKECFKLVKQGNRKVLGLLKSCNSSDEDNKLSVLMNCVNSKGFSLMAIALQLGHTEIAQDIMKLRLDQL